jgi:hypothetical protein
VRTPTVGSVVHYVSRGSADGVYPPTCRAATITEVDPENPARVGVAVTNPTGHFFRPLSEGGCEQHELPPFQVRPEDPTEHKPGSWHWPERV